MAICNFRVLGYNTFAGLGKLLYKVTRCRYRSRNSLTLLIEKNNSLSLPLLNN